MGHGLILEKSTAAILVAKHVQDVWRADFIENVGICARCFVLGQRSCVPFSSISIYSPEFTLIGQASYLCQLMLFSESRPAH
jgi:hypothetical protein